MSSRRKFIQKLTAPVLALPLLNLTQTKFFLIQKKNRTTARY